MNKKIDLNEIIKNMNERFPEGSLSELEKARFLYLELGKLLSFDINYISAHDRKSEDIYWKPVDFDNIESNKFICRQIADMYSELLARAGIDSEPEWDIREYEIKELMADEDWTFRHKFTVVKLKDGRQFIADLVYDLPFIQKGMETLNFGTREHNCMPEIEKIDQDEIREADKKFGFSYPADLTGDKFVYYDNFIQMVKEDMNNEEHLRDYVSVQFSEEEAEAIKSNSLIKYKFDIMCKFFDVSNFGFREGRMVLERILMDFFTEEEKKSITMHDLFTEHEKDNGLWGGHSVGKTDMMKCFVWKKDDGNFEYYIYEDGKNLRKIDKKDLKDYLKEEGYINQRSKDVIPGFDDDGDAR